MLEEINKELKGNRVAPMEKGRFLSWVGIPTSGNGGEDWWRP